MTSAEKELKERTLRELIDLIREDGESEGWVYLHGGKGVERDTITVSLARFQSYRGRTIAALIEELDDFTVGANRLEFEVDDVLVHLTVT